MQKTSFFILIGDLQIIFFLQENNLQKALIPFIGAKLASFKFRRKIYNMILRLSKLMETTGINIVCHFDLATRPFRLTRPCHFDRQGEIFQGCPGGTGFLALLEMTLQLDMTLRPKMTMRVVISTVREKSFRAARWYRISRLARNDIAARQTLQLEITL
jgi:hypothetical protein